MSWPVCYSEVSSYIEIAENSLNGRDMSLGEFRSELGKTLDGVRDIRTGCNSGVHKRTDDSGVREVEGRRFFLGRGCEHDRGIKWCVNNSGI